MSEAPMTPQLEKQLAEAVDRAAREEHPYAPSVRHTTKERLIRHFTPLFAAHATEITEKDGEIERLKDQITAMNKAWYGDLDLLRNANAQLAAAKEREGRMREAGGKVLAEIDEVGSPSLGSVERFRSALSPAPEAKGDPAPPSDAPSAEEVRAMLDITTSQQVHTDWASDLARLARAYLDLLERVRGLEEAAANASAFLLSYPNGLANDMSPAQAKMFHSLMVEYGNQLRSALSPAPEAKGDPAPPSDAPSAEEVRAMLEPIESDDVTGAERTAGYVKCLQNFPRLARAHLDLLGRVRELEEAIANVSMSMKLKVRDCCNSKTGKVFCESYGCGTLANYVSQLDAALAAKGEK